MLPKYKTKPTAPFRNRKKKSVELWQIACRHKKVELKCVSWKPPSLCQTVANSDRWGEWKPRMLLPLQENPILSVARKNLITPFGFVQLPGYTQGARRSHLMVCVMWYAVLCLFCVIFSLLDWNLRNMSAENKAINFWWSNQIILSNWNQSFKNHYNLKAIGLKTSYA